VIIIRHPYFSGSEVSSWPGSLISVREFPQPPETTWVTLH